MTYDSKMKITEKKDSINDYLLNKKIKNLYNSENIDIDLNLFIFFVKEYIKNKTGSLYMCRSCHFFRYETGCNNSVCNEFKKGMLKKYNIL